MYAEPVLEVPSMSWMIAELVKIDNISLLCQSKPYRATYVSTLFPEPAMEPEVC